MTEDLSILALIKRIEYTGFTIHPYVFEKTNLRYINPLERITNLNFETYSSLSPVAIRLFQLSEEIEPHALLTRFTKQKITLKEFFSKHEKIVNELVLPFVDSRLNEIIGLLAQSSIPLYDASAMPHLYPPDEIKITPGIAKTVLRFDRNNEGTVYSLEVFTGKTKINLQDQSGYLISNSPCLLIIRNNLIIFERNITGKILSPFLQKEHIVIPKRLENKYFSSFIKKLVNNSEIIAKGFDVRDIKVDPEAILTLETDWQEKPCLTLKFKYGEKAILANNTLKSFTDLRSDDDGFTFFRLQRDKSWENQKIEFLKHEGLHQFTAFFFLKDSQNNSYDQNTNYHYTADNLRKDYTPELLKKGLTYSLLRWLINKKQTLIDNGFTIDTNTENQYALSYGEIRQDLKTENDWFDINLILLIEDQEIPFIRLRSHILDRQREYLLPNGKVFLIPEPWFDKYKELMIHAEVVDNRLKLNKHHYTLLNRVNPGEINKPDVYSPPASLKLPPLNNVNLRPYQITGFEWMVHISNMGFGGILADDMGLGKTLQTIAVLSHYYTSIENVTSSGYQQGESDISSTDSDSTAIQTPENKQLNKQTSFQLYLFEPPVESVTSITDKKVPSDKYIQGNKNTAASLIVMPASLIHNWENELNRFAPFLRKLIYTGSGRKKSIKYFDNYQIILTTYGTLRNDIDFIGNYEFLFAILDEGQQIKNPQSLIAKSVFNINAQHKLVLTGTPVENSLIDLWSQMNFTNRGLLGDLHKFNTYYATPLSKDPESYQAVSLLSMIKPFILRRTKESVTPELPDLTETVTFCEMTEKQHTLYESEKSKIRNVVLEQIENGKISETPIMVLKALMQLRQVSNHPRMLDDKSNAGSGKYDEIADRLATIISEKHRVLIFSSFVKHLNLMEEHCLEMGYKYTKLTGSSTNRGKIVSGFKNNEDTGVFLISLKAGGVGLNLTEADYVFILDPWWNPAAEMQAINRAHRIGQDKGVFVYRFITKDSIEEKILQLQLKKKALADAFIKPQSFISGMSKEELVQLFE